MVPGLVKEYRRKHPRIQFTLLVQRSGEMLMEELAGGGIDLCLSVPGMFGQSDVRWNHLLDEELLIAMPRTHRLAARRTLSLKELSSEPFLALSPEHTLRIIFDRLCADASFVPKIAFEGMDIATLRGLIAAGLGIGLLPPAPSRFAGVVEVKLSPARPIRPLGIGWIADHYLPASAIEFRKFVVSKFHGE
jgi:DNA-binding transcriptional LysR family regulator